MSDTNNMATNASRNGYPETYYPNTEVLGENEMRIVALGTGRPFCDALKQMHLGLLNLAMETNLFLTMDLAHK